VGPGDDCAVVPGSRQPLCVTTDAVVEGVHFRRSDGPLEDVGYKALAVNLSDLAAMGARPRWFLCALAAPTLTLAEVRALARGMSALARKCHLPLVGGNVTRASELSLTLTVGGTPVGRAPLLRSGGRASDVLYVSGTLGAARLGLLSLAARPGVRRFPRAERRQRRPQPRLQLGALAAGYASAAIDVSDGLVQDLGHLLAASRVGAELELAHLPIDRDVRRAFPNPGHALQVALVGGEDYELLLAVPGPAVSAFERRCARAGEQVTRIGRLVRGRSLRLVDALGRTRKPPGEGGFDHFRNG
jgi:thiamine-monophosphate kinase